jgi:hypothetical protein
MRQSGTGGGDTSRVKRVAIPRLANTSARSPFETVSPPATLTIPGVARALSDIRAATASSRVM